MRISRIQLAGLAAVLAGGAAQNAAADDLTVSTARTQPVVTSNANNGSAGDVLVTNQGSITITAGQTAITVDSDNDAENRGTIASSEANGTTGILILDGHTGTITNAGSINLLETHDFGATDSDGDPDGTWAVGSNRSGIHLDGGFTGNIINSGTINVESNNATGIWIQGTLTGDINDTGAILVTGDNSVGIWINNPGGVGLDGDLFVRGTINARGGNTVGILVDSLITGDLTVNGSITATGYPSTTPTGDQSNLDPEDDLLQGGSAILVLDSINGGFTVEGIGVENDGDDDNDGSVDPTDVDDDQNALVASFGSAPGIHILADGNNIVLGDTGNGFGFYNRGNVQGNGVFDGFDATGLRLEGIGGATVTTAGGILNDRLFSATAEEASAYALSIGAGVDVPLLHNRNSISAQVTSTGADTSYAVFVEGGSMPQLINNNLIRASLNGNIGNATAVYDATGTLTSITNTGSIVAVLFPVDDDLTDDTVPLPTGDAVAIDVSAAASGVTIQQSPDVPFTDQDGVDDDVNSRPPVLIAGDVRLGAFADTFNLEAGEVRGDVYFGAGADVFLIDNDAEFRGSIIDSDGSLAITVNEGTLDLRGGDANNEVNITSAFFGADSALRVQLSGPGENSTLIQASGAVTFVSGAEVSVALPSGLPQSDTVVFLTANQLFGGALVENPNVTGTGVPFLYNLAIERTNQAAADGAANGLQAVYDLKTAADLGLTANQGAAYNEIVAALNRSSAASSAILSLDNVDAFQDAYEDLMPSFSSAAAELAATAIQQAQGATGNRMAAMRLQGLDEVSVWAQEIGYFVSREPPSLNGQEFSGHGFGMAIGIDGPLNNGALFGLSASLIASEVEEEGRPEGEIAVTLGQLGAYYGSAMGPVDLDFAVGLGAGKLSSQRVVEIGTAFSDQAEAEWWAYEGHGLVRASVPLRLGNSFVITPQAQLTYLFMSEEGYEEIGGGPAIDYEVGDVTSQRLWGDVGVELSARLRMRGNTIVAPRLFAGYRTNVIDEETERDFRFVSGTEEFTLVDEPFGDGGALFGLGIDATNGYSTFSIGYEGEFGDQIERHSINAAVRFRF